MTLVTEDNKRIRAHKVVLASASSIFRDLFQTDFEDNEYQVIYMRGVATKHVVAMVDLVYNGETKVKERDCAEFLQIIKEYKILKVKTTEETQHVKCNFYNRGFCKAGQACAYDHPDEDCETHMVGNICKDKKCKKRHRTTCKYSESKIGCKRGSECMYLHKDPKEQFVQNSSKEKCDTCKFKNFDKNQVKEYNVKEQRFMICSKCDKFLEHKEILLTDNFSMKDWLSVKLPKASLEEISHMVNY